MAGKFPDFEPLTPRYPTPYYSGFYILRSPDQWASRGRFVPIKRRPIRAHKKSIQRWEFHPWYQMPRTIDMMRKRTTWYSPFE